MKFKNILLASLLVISQASFAEPFVVISESKEGNQLFLDVDSVIVKRNDADKVMYVAGMFVYPIPNEPTVPFVITVPVSSCNKGMGTLFHLEKSDKTWEIVEQYFWSTKGTKIYDHSAIALCMIHKEKTKGISV